MNTETTKQVDDFFKWLYEKCKNVNYCSDEEFENIVEKLEQSNKDLKEIQVKYRNEKR